MNGKKKIQLFLFLFLIILSFVFFKKYIFQNNVDLDNQINLEENNEIIEKSNIIYNIEYSSIDKDGNNFIIKSELGNISNDNANVISMEIVVATITLKNEGIIKINAKNAIYNSKTLDTNFFNNVIMSYAENEINSDNVDLFFQKNLISITNNVFYKNLNTNLRADKVQIDLVTKDIKISMKNKDEHVIIKSIN
jgi:hypothetical protein